MYFIVHEFFSLEIFDPFKNVKMEFFSFIKEANINKLAFVPILLKYLHLRLIFHSQNKKQLFNAHNSDVILVPRVLNVFSNVYHPLHSVMFLMIDLVIKHKLSQDRIHPAST